MKSVDSISLDDVTLSCLVAGEGPVVLCAHGFPDDARTFRHQVKPLIERGFRVVCPTMRGYAPSSISRSSRYDAEALARDIVALADHYSPHAPVRFIGHDWGAVAGFAATALAPQKFSHLVTIAVPHLRAAAPALVTPRQARRSWYVFMFQLRIIAEMRLAENNLALIDRLWRDWSPSYTPSKEDLDLVKEGIASRIPEVLAYYRAFFAPNSLLGTPRSLLLAKTTVPSLHVHGEEDGCMGVELTYGTEKHYASKVSIQRIANAGHFVHLEKPDAVNPLLLDFLGSP